MIADTDYEIMLQDEFVGTIMREGLKNEKMNNGEKLMNSQIWSEISEHYKRAKQCLWGSDTPEEWHRDEEQGRDNRQL